MVNMLDRDLLSIQDIRLLSLVSGYYIDYMLNDNLMFILKKPNKFTRDLTTANKINLLEALGFFDPLNKTQHEQDNPSHYYYTTDELYEEIKIFNNIRNYYAHTMINDLEKSPDDIRASIGKLVIKAKKIAPDATDLVVLRNTLSFIITDLLLRSTIQDALNMFGTAEHLNNVTISYSKNNIKN